MSYLVAQVVGKLPTASTPTFWLQAAVSLLTIIFVWNEWAMVTLAFSWTPRFADAAIPFLFGVTELVQIFSIGQSFAVWVGSCPLVFAMGLACYGYVYRRASAHAHNTRFLAVYGGAPSYIASVVGLLVGLFLFVLTLAGRLDAHTWVAAAIVLGCVSALVGVRIKQWEHAIHTLLPSTT
jgi:hypothetical protein